MTWPFSVMILSLNWRCSLFLTFLRDLKRNIKLSDWFQSRLCHGTVTHRWFKMPRLVSRSASNRARRESTNLFNWPWRKPVLVIPLQWSTMASISTSWVLHWNGWLQSRIRSLLRRELSRRECLSWEWRVSPSPTTCTTPSSTKRPRPLWKKSWCDYYI